LDEAVCREVTTAPAPPPVAFVPKAKKTTKPHGGHESGRIEIEPVEGEFRKTLNKS
jgi:hypothetical protein